MAKIPVGLRLELVGSEVSFSYRTDTDQLGFRGDAAGRIFEVFFDGVSVGQVPAVLGEGTVSWRRTERGRIIVYMPEGMRPEVLDVLTDGEPAPPAPKWVAYGDSIAEGYSASHPSGAWPAIAAREHDLDLVNLGFAGAARGELVSAEHVASLASDVISITHGTNCWRSIPHTTGQMRENLLAFLAVVRAAHPTVPIVASTPIVRPDAEATPNALGASLSDLREAMAEVYASRNDIVFVPGHDIVAPADLVDDVHPGDDGHRKLADALGPVIAGAVG